jgi:DNA invertase Pin-like site-specific DNA recombinase
VEEREPVIDPARVAVYIRWSTEDQTSGTTLEVQEEACRHYVLSQGWQTNTRLLYIDEGYTGATLNRPGMESMRKAIQSGAIHCVVVYKLDRLSRSVLDTVNLVLHEWKGRCHLKSTRELVDTTTPQGRMIFYVLVSFAEHEREVIRERMYSGKLQRALQGRNPGRVLPYGFRKGEGPGQAVLLPEQAEVVRRIYREYLAGKGLRTLCRELNGEGGYGAAWTVKRLQALLENPLYRGELVWGARRITREAGRVRAERRERPVVSGVSFTAALPDGTAAGPVVDPETWERVQQARRRRQAPALFTRAGGSPYLLTGLARCRCGWSLVAQRRRGVPWYRCSRKHQGQACDQPDIRQAEIDAAVAGALVPLIPGDSLRQNVRALMEEEAAVLHRTALARLALAEAGVQKAEAQWRRISRDYREGLIRAGEFQALLGEVESDRERCRRGLAAAAAALAESTAWQAGGRAGRSGRPAWERRLASLDPWGALQVGQRKQVLRELVRRLAVSAGADGELAVELVLPVRLARTGTVGTGPAGVCQLYPRAATQTFPQQKVEPAPANVPG